MVYDKRLIPRRDNVILIALICQTDQWSLWLNKNIFFQLFLLPLSSSISLSLPSSFPNLNLIHFFNSHTIRYQHWDALNLHSRTTGIVFSKQSIRLNMCVILPTSSQTRQTQVANWFAPLAIHGIEIYQIVLVCVAADFRILHESQKFKYRMFSRKFDVCVCDSDNTHWLCVYYKLQIMLEARRLSYIFSFSNLCIGDYSLVSTQYCVKRFCACPTVINNINTHADERAHSKIMHRLMAK